jgi:hypothetical protein
MLKNDSKAGRHFVVVSPPVEKRNPADFSPAGKWDEKWCRDRLKRVVIHPVMLMSVMVRQQIPPLRNEVNL